MPPMTLEDAAEAAEAASHAGLMPPTTLNDLDRVVDIYYLEPVTGAPVESERTGGQGAYVFYGPPTRADLRGTELAGWVDRLAAKINEEYPSAEDFRIEFEGRSFRGCRDFSGLTCEVALRRLPAQVPLLSDLTFDLDSVRGLLEAPWLDRGGLVLFCGLTGQGKTTVANAAVRSRLERYAGRCVTVEDPPELPMEGFFGQGACRQLQVDYTAADPWRRGFAGAMRRAYRKLPATRPAMLLVGEVRDNETAAELVKAALNGMLVFSTIHAHDAIAAVTRLVTMAEQTLGESASLLVGQALRMVVHNKLVLSAKADGWKRGEFFSQILFSDADNHPVANLIRTQRYPQLIQVQNFQMSHVRNAHRGGLSAGELMAEIGSKSAAMSSYAPK